MRKTEKQKKLEAVNQKLLRIEARVRDIQYKLYHDELLDASDEIVDKLGNVVQALISAWDAIEKRIQSTNS